MNEPKLTTHAPLDRRHLLRFALWLALAFGLGEAVLVAIVTFGLGRFMHVSPQLVWQAPLSFAIVFVALALLAMLPLPRLSMRHRLRLLAFACAFVGCVSILLMASQLSRLAVALLAAGISVQLSYMAVRFDGLVRRIMRITLVPGVLLVAALGVGLNGVWWWAERRQPAVAASDSRPNVVLIIWDTVRAASLSLYGYPRQTTPHLEQLAAESIVFDNAFAPAPWTLPSHASMFTGLHPAQMNADWSEPLTGDVTTLAEVLNGEGYRTGGFVANTYFAGRESGLSQGFGRYEDFPILSIQQLVRSTTLGRRIIRSPRIVRMFDLDPSMELKSAREITDHALAWILDEPNHPFFAFLNYLDAHSPYSPPSPYDTTFGSIPRHQKLNFGNGSRLTPTQLQAEIDAYDGAIAYLDDELNRLVRRLDSAGILDRTILVITSDHGEEFGEHDVYLHGSTLYDRSLHVPLVIHMPGSSRGVRHDAWVSMSNLPSTILELADIDGHAIPGRSLAWLAPDDSLPQARDTILTTLTTRPGVLPRYPAAKGPMTSVMMDPWKYIRRGDGAEELFDLRADRDERRNLIATAPGALLELMRTRAADVRHIVAR